jgi:murein L,D-transpeptidase YcbB/YkuD
MRKTIAVLAILLVPSLGLAQSTSEQELIGAAVEQLRTGGALEIEGESIAAGPLLAEIYERRGFTTAWAPEKISELIGIIGGIESEGLDPSDYHLEALQRLGGVSIPSDPRRRVELDILAGDSLVRLGYHLRFGKVNPSDLDPNWNLSRNLSGRDPATMVQAALNAPTLHQFIAANLPRGPIYARLKKALVRYRAIRDRGGWPVVPEGPTLKPGMVDRRVPAVRERLAVTGELTGPAQGDPASFDDNLRAAVVEFQERHGIDADGVIGPATLDAMNVPVEARVDQLRVNMERVRWIFRDIEESLIITNIARFRVLLVRDGEPIWIGKAQVGKPYRRTPVFKSTLRYLVFNPTWTVPPTILRKDILPKAKEDPAYLSRKNIRILDPDGSTIDPATIDWPSVTTGRFPYILRQDPGPDNALGRVKFIFPNDHFVFLHDTPSKALFDRTARAFSSGCIRVERPFELAALLLEGTPWDAEAIRKLVDSAETKTVFLPEPLTVFLLYGTVDAMDNERVIFLPDIYDRDPAVLEALDGVFVFTPPAGMPEWAQ